MNATITLHTELNKGIYASCGGGQNLTREIWTLGPRTLVKARKALLAEREENRRRYGDIGRGHSWIEIDGVQLDLDVFGSPDTCTSPTAWAQYLIANLHRVADFEQTLADYAKRDREAAEMSA